MKTKLLIPVIALTLISVVSCKQKAQEVALPQVQAIQIKDTSCIVEYSFPATIKGVQDVAIFPQVTGRITNKLVEKGTYVKKGDVLFEIDDVPYKAAYDQALAQVEVSKAQLETARLTYQSKKNLFDKGIISEYQVKLAANSVTTAKAVLGQSEAALKSASNDLSFTKVRTMSAGVLGETPFKVGTLVSPNMGNPLTTVSDNSEIYADFSIPENTYLNIAKDLNKLYDTKERPDNFLPLTLRTNTGEIYGETGKISSISGVISSATGSVPVSAIFPNKDGVLLSGGACSVVFRYRYDDAIIIPRSSMKEIQNKLFVFVIGDDGVLTQTPVNAYRYSPKEWMLLPNDDGTMPVKIGDKITASTNRLVDGVQVQVIE